MLLIWILRDLKIIVNELSYSGKLLNQQLEFSAIRPNKKKKSISHYKIWSDKENHCVSISKLSCFLKFPSYLGQKYIQFILILSIHRWNKRWKKTNGSITFTELFFSARKPFCEVANSERKVWWDNEKPKFNP